MLKDKIKLPSRYNDVDTFLYPIEHNYGIIVSNGSYTRHIMSDDKKTIEAIDFEGGPMLNIGYNFNDKKIKSIKNAYYIELE